MITYKEGDIFDYITKDCVVVHQVNCQGVMGVGIAKTIKTKFPRTFQKYKDSCDKLSYCEKEQLLGKLLYTNEYIEDYGFKIKIANCFGQYRYGRDKRYTDYEALSSCFKKITTVTNTTQDILIPYKIGCCNAGGDWNIVLSIIEEVFVDYNVVIVKFDKYR